MRYNLVVLDYVGVRQSYLMPPNNATDMENWVDCILKPIEREGKWAPAKRGRKAVESGRDAPATDKADPEGVIDGVVSSRVSHTHTTSLGPVLAGLHFWDKPGMP